MHSLLEDEPQEIEIPADGSSLDLLRAVYRCNQLPLPIRMRAAIACLPHEVPRLAVTAQITDQGIAELLDRRLKRIEEMKLIEAKPTAQTNANKSVLPGHADSALSQTVISNDFQDRL